MPNTGQHVDLTEMQYRVLLYIGQFMGYNIIPLEKWTEAIRYSRLIYDLMDFFPLYTLSEENNKRKQVRLECRAFHVFIPLQRHTGALWS